MVSGIFTGLPRRSAPRNDVCFVSGGLALDTIAEVRQLYQLLKHLPMVLRKRLLLEEKLSPKVTDEV